LCAFFILIPLLYAWKGDAGGASFDDEGGIVMGDRGKKDKGKKEQQKKAKLTPKEKRQAKKEKKKK
jgi:hypothetical protein